jgi:hypothetical protein
MTTSTRVAVCGYGTTCSATVSQAAATHEYVAYLSADSAAYPPSPVVASSNVATTYLRIIP